MTRVDQPPSAAGAATETAAGHAKPADPRIVWVRRVLVLGWAIALIISWTMHGVPLDRTGLLLWIGGGLLAWSIGHRPLWTVVLDWLPFAAMLTLYDYSRGLALHLHRPTLWTPQITSDRWLGFGHDPTSWLQSHLKMPQPAWWEVIVSCTYTSFFLAPYLIAGVLWVRDRRLWRRFATLFIGISMLGLIGFVLYPAAPPWAASQCTAVQVADHPADPTCMTLPNGRADGGLVDPVHNTHGAANYVERISGRGFAKLGLKTAESTLSEGQAAANEVAAIPSLHAAITLLVTLFLWPIVRRRWRPLLVAYPLVMAFSLVYSAEHYLTDILIGSALTTVVWLAVGWWDRRRKKVADADTLHLSEIPATDGDPSCPPTEMTPSSASPSAEASSSRRRISMEVADPPGTTAPSV